MSSRSGSPDAGASGRLFGGLIAAPALATAGATVDDVEFHVERTSFHHPEPGR